MPEALRGLSATEVEDAIRQALLEKEDNPYRSKKGYEGVRRQVLVETDIVGDIIKLDKEKVGDGGGGGGGTHHRQGGVCMLKF